MDIDSGVERYSG